MSQTRFSATYRNDGRLYHFSQKIGGIGTWTYKNGGTIVKQKCRDDEQLRHQIMQVIDYELSKQNPDMKLVEAYSAVLRQQEHGACLPDPGQQKKALRKLKRTYRTVTAADSGGTRQTLRWRKTVHRVSGVLCSVIVVIGLLFGSVYAAGGLSPTEILENIGQALFGWEIGEGVEIEGMTFVRNGTSMHYDSIEQCLAEEHLDICYPTWLPDGVRVESVLVFSEDSDHEIIFHMNSDKVYISMNRQEKIENIREMHYTADEINGIPFYYLFGDQERYYAKVDFFGRVYSVTSNDFSIVKNVIAGMRRETKD